MYKLYQMQDSGNCYKLRLAMAQLDIPFVTKNINILEGESRTADFLSKNPNGKVPVLEIPDGSYLPESNAALYYLAQGTSLFPTGRLEQAQVMQWMFFEQYSHEPYIAVARFWRKIAPGGNEEKKDSFPLWWEKGYQALDVMEQQLEGQDYFVGDTCSIADIALYAYSHMAEDGGFDLSRYPAVLHWLERMRNRDGHVTLAWKP